MVELSVVAAVSAGLGAIVSNLGAEAVKAIFRRGQYAETIRDEDLIRMQKEISSLRTGAERYWTNDAPSLGVDEHILKARIVASQQTLTELISGSFTGKPKRECDVALTFVLKAVSGGEFGQDNRSAQPERLAQVFIKLDALEREITVARRQLPRPWLS